MRFSCRYILPCPRKLSIRSATLLTIGLSNLCGLKDRSMYVFSGGNFTLAKKFGILHVCLALDVVFQKSN